MKGYRHLTLARRYLIQELLGMGKPYVFIAEEVGCHRSTIYREVRRNTREVWGYRARIAQEESVLRRPEQDESKRKIRGVLKEIVIEKLTEAAWSPQQIEVRLRVEGRAAVSHEAIYRFIYEDRLCGGTLYKALRFHGRRRKRVLVRKSRLWKKVEPRKFIELRPKAAAQRSKLGHWERDLVIGQRKEESVLLTIVDRKSRFTLVRKVMAKTCKAVGAETVQAFKNQPELPCKTMTNDNGFEFGGFIQLEKELKAPIYFTHPYCSWERGTNENTNGLLREFFPKGRPITPVEPQEIERVVDLLNSRPRKVLGYRTPREVLYNRSEKLFRSDYYYRQKLKERELSAAA